MLSNWSPYFVRKEFVAFWNLSKIAFWNLSEILRANSDEGFLKAEILKYYIFALIARTLTIWAL
jgi:hypothetical protein